jgi:hypothetical protein
VIGGTLDGREAIDTIRFITDLVFLDVQMAGGRLTVLDEIGEDRIQPSSS